MRVEELRVGNWISVYGTNGNPKGWTDMQIIPNHIVTCYTNPEWFKPISLTKKWKFKLGLNTETERLKLNSEFGEALIVLKELNHVHKLQNLYYEFMKHELF